MVGSLEKEMRKLVEKMRTLDREMGIIVQKMRKKDKKVRILEKEASFGEEERKVS